MTYKSGRTLEQGLRPFVIEGDKLYIPPKRYSLFNKTLHSHCNPESEAAEYAALRALGFLDAEILRGVSFTVIVDYELKS